MMSSRSSLTEDSRGRKRRAAATTAMKTFVSYTRTRKSVDTGKRTIKRAKSTPNQSVGPDINTPTGSTIRTSTNTTTESTVCTATDAAIGSTVSISAIPVIATSPSGDNIFINTGIVTTPSRDNLIPLTSNFDTQKDTIPDANDIAVGSSGAETNEEIPHDTRQDMIVDAIVINPVTKESTPIIEDETKHPSEFSCVPPRIDTNTITIPATNTRDANESNTHLDDVNKQPIIGKEIPVTILSPELGVISEKAQSQLPKDEPSQVMPETTKPKNSDVVPVVDTVVNDTPEEKSDQNSNEEITSTSVASIQNESGREMKQTDTYVPVIPTTMTTNPAIDVEKPEIQYPTPQLSISQTESTIEQATPVKPLVNITRGTLYPTPSSSGEAISTTQQCQQEVPPQSCGIAKWSALDGQNGCRRFVTWDAVFETEWFRKPNQRQVINAANFIPVFTTQFSSQQRSVRCHPFIGTCLELVTGFDSEGDDNRSYHVVHRIDTKGEHESVRYHYPKHALNTSVTCTGHLILSSWCHYQTTAPNVVHTTIFDVTTNQPVGPGATYSTRLPFINTEPLSDRSFMHVPYPYGRSGYIIVCPLPGEQPRLFLQNASAPSVLVPVQLSGNGIDNLAYIVNDIGVLQFSRQNDAVTIKGNITLMRFIKHHNGSINIGTTEVWKMDAGVAVAVEILSSGIVVLLRMFGNNGFFNFASVDGPKGLKMLSDTVTTLMPGFNALRPFTPKTNDVSEFVTFHALGKNRAICMVKDPAAPWRPGKIWCVRRLIDATRVDEIVLSDSIANSLCVTQYATNWGCHDVTLIDENSGITVVRGFEKTDGAIPTYPMCFASVDVDDHDIVAVATIDITDNTKLKKSRVVYNDGSETTTDLVHGLKILPFLENIYM